MRSYCTFSIGRKSLGGHIRIGQKDNIPVEQAGLVYLVPLKEANIQIIFGNSQNMCMA